MANLAEDSGVWYCPSICAKVCCEQLLRARYQNMQSALRCCSWLLFLQRWCFASTTVLAWLAGGAVGPGRMAELGPAPFQVVLHAVPSLGLGGLLGGLLATWRHRRTTA